MRGNTRFQLTEMLSPTEAKDIFLKPNFNSADPAPGSTHNDVLQALVQRYQSMGAQRIMVGDRSGMGNTEAVMRQKGIFRMADELGFETLLFDYLADDEWEIHQFEGSHWRLGFPIARPVLDAEAGIQAGRVTTASPATTRSIR